MSAIKYIYLIICSLTVVRLSKSCNRQCTAFETGFFIDTPDHEVYSHEGNDVTLVWLFHVGSWSTSPTKVREFLFGVWGGHGYVKNKIVSVCEDNSVLKRGGFDRKVDWTGNMYNCSDCNATVIMYNLTAADFRTYGVEVEPLDLKNMPLKNWLTIVKFEPAKIVKWMTDINVEEGNATTVECKATGRPTPSVIIQRDNDHSLCNGTGQCLYEISAADKSVHEGKYYCLVQQRNSSQIRRTLNLTVLPRIPAAGMADNRASKSKTTDSVHTADTADILMTVAVMTGLIVLLALIISLKVFYSRESSRLSSTGLVIRYSKSIDDDALALTQEREHELISYVQDEDNDVNDVGKERERDRVIVKWSERVQN